MIIHTLTEIVIMHEVSYGKWKKNVENYVEECKEMLERKKYIHLR